MSEESTYLIQALEQRAEKAEEECDRLQLDLTAARDVIKQLTEVDACYWQEKQAVKAERDRLKEELEICRGATETEVSRAYRVERDRLREALKICLGELQAPTSGVRG